MNGHVWKVLILRVRAERFKRRAARKRPSDRFGRLDQSEKTRGIYFRVPSSTAFSHFINRFSTDRRELTRISAELLMRVKLAMSLMFRVAGVLILAALFPSIATAQAPVSSVLFRVFLSDGRVLSSYGEWARLDDRVIFSMPTQLTRDPVESAPRHDPRRSASTGRARSNTRNRCGPPPTRRRGATRISPRSAARSRRS